MMERNRARWLVRFAVVTASLVFSLLTSGCMPRVIVRSHPRADDRGIRFYRPKPYLKVEPAEVAVDKNQSSIVPGLVRISLVYLPDFSEEYAIDVRSGLGIANVGIKLQDGWNLTEISQELDSQTDENAKALASLLTSVGEVIPTAGGATNQSAPSFTVPARNVPLGFYESILGRDGRGCKRLYGFRYVGFIPFSGCPLEMSGQQSTCYDDPQSGLYGLSFVDGQMLFQPLSEMAHLDAKGHSSTKLSSANVSPTAPNNSAVSDPAQPLHLPLPDDQLRRVELDLRAHLSSLFDSVGEVRAKAVDSTIAVTIRIPATTPSLPIHQAAQQWLQSNLGSAHLFDVQLLTR